MEHHTVKFEEAKNCIAEKVDLYLFNERNGIHADYMASQWTPVESGYQPGLMIEPIEWRDDGKCSSDFNPIRATVGLHAKCSHPNVGDSQRDLARCCYENTCMTLEDSNECSNQESTLHVSVDEKTTAALINMHSLHIGIVNFFPFIFGKEHKAEVIEKLFTLLEDEK